MVDTMSSANLDNNLEETICNKLPRRKALTTKAAVTFLLEGKLKNNVCRYCLNVDSPLTELDIILHIANKGIIYNVSVRDMVASFHPVKVVNDVNFPNKICEICLEQTLSSYLFAQQCERAERALRNCFDDIYDKTLKLDSLDNINKRGKKKLKPNYNTIYSEHKNVIDYAEPIINLINTNTELQERNSNLQEIDLNVHECPKCWQRFPTATALLNHEKVHPTSMWYHCRVCGRSFAKRHHLKKHVRSNHSKKPINKDNITFNCKECGNESLNYATHLEHIEKHKFKRALRHLVERQTDKICSVCLSKGRLSDMDKMICLHGGRPGLTGDISLYNILGSTIPTMINLHSYTGNKICDLCYNSVISSYIFINHINDIRIRLNNCISLMLKSLNSIEKPEENVFVEISQKAILSINDDFDELLLINENEEIDESKLRFDFLEDEFREDSEADSSETDHKSEIKRGDSNDLFNDDSDLEFSPGCVTKSYFNKRKLYNGFHNTHATDVCSEFLTFKKKKVHKKTIKHRLPCPFCSKRFISNYFLSKHVVKHIAKPVECLVCGLKFKSKFDLYEHVKMIHLQNKDSYHSCPTCGRCFTNIDKYTSHLGTHNVTQCQLCDKKFITQKHFENHLIRHTVKFRAFRQKRIFYCSFCEKDCTNDNELSLHVNKVHLHIKPHSCDMCDRQYYTESNLRGHKIIHTLPNKEKCKFCDINIKCRRDLVLHLRKHLNCKPYTCKVCIKSFYSESGVRKHLKLVHGGVFCCHACKSTFSTKRDLIKHGSDCEFTSQCY